MVASLNKQFIEQLNGFQCIAIAPTVAEARGVMKKHTVDLVLLDVYMPGDTGLDFLKELREQAKQVDVILITAASEEIQIREALRLGAIDYLVKPFEFERLREAVQKFKRYDTLLSGRREIMQHEIDHLFSPSITQEPSKVLIPKGLTKTTLELVIDVMAGLAPSSFSTDEMAEATNLSRVSIRKYLKFLTNIGWLEETLNYGIGRPVYSYRVTSHQLSKDDFYT